MRTEDEAGAAAAEPRPVLLEPWGRAKAPTVLPDPVDAGTLRALPAEDFARLLRDHLMPRQPSGPQHERWARLWDALSRDEELAERAYDVLEAFLEQTEQALESGALEEHQRRRARKFARACDDGWQRLRIVDDKPLGWAGRRASGFNAPARRVLERLVDAIAEHRRQVMAGGSASAVDQRLWQALREVGLDPELGRGRR